MFGFPATEYIVYKRNFLRKVFFQIDLKKTTKIVDSDESIKSIFLERFPRFVKAQGNGIQITIDRDAPRMETLKENETYIFKSTDGQITIEVGDTFVKLIFDTPAYTSSDSVRNIIPLIHSLLEGKIEKVDRITLKKINIVEFDNSSNPNGVLYFLLNRSIVGNVDSFPNTNLINHNLQSVNYRNEDYFLNLKYGMNLPPIPNLNIGQIIIDIESAKHTVTGINEIKDVFDNINNEIFNVFNMLINDNFKNILNGN